MVRFRPSVTVGERARPWGTPWGTRCGEAGVAAILDGTLRDPHGLVGTSVMPRTR